MEVFGIKISTWKNPKNETRYEIDGKDGEYRNLSKDAARAVLAYEARNHPEYLEAILILASREN